MNRIYLNRDRLSPAVKRYNQPMPARASILLLAAVALFSGCSRARITTEIKGDNWTRTVALSGPEKKDGSTNMAPSLEEAFVLPAREGWRSREEKKDTERTLIFERTLAPGAIIQGDLSIKGAEPGKLTLVNEVTVSRIAPRRFEYRETLRWTGPPPDTLAIKPEQLAQIKAVLPKELATDANARAVLEKIGKLAVPLLFGPGDPLLALGLIHPDLAARRMSQRVGAVMMKALEEQFGDKLPPAERRELARKLIELTVAQTKPPQPDPAKGPKPDSGAGLIPLMFVFKASGKVISTNGDVDELASEIYWALFPEAASLQPVTLTAVVQMDPQ
jgi:hypothetical protein